MQVYVDVDVDVGDDDDDDDESWTFNMLFRMFHANMICEEIYYQH